MSSQADSRYEAANRQIDSSNTYLWRFRLQRLEAEPLWDSILSSAGELDVSVGDVAARWLGTDPPCRTGHSRAPVRETLRSSDPLVPCLLKVPGVEPFYLDRPR
jgi:hypothetical protein